MEKIRLGNDIEMRWSIFTRDGDNRVPYDLEGRALTLSVVNRKGESEIEFFAEGNIVTGVFRGRDQKILGRHGVILRENNGEDGMRTVDACDAFEIVACSCEEALGSPGTIQLFHLTFDTTIGAITGTIDPILNYEAEQAEAERKANEIVRKANEEQRIENENQRKIDEATRIQFEQQRVNDEAMRRSREADRQESENIRQKNEGDRILAERERQESENIRQKNEGDRILAEREREETMRNLVEELKGLAANKFKIVDILPEVGEFAVIYLVPSTTPSDNDVYDEWAYVSEKWEHIGSTRFELDNYYTKEEVERLLATKQDTLTAGENITIEENVISSTGGGGGGGIYPSDMNDDFNDDFAN